MAEDAGHHMHGCPVSHRSATRLKCEARCHLGSESPASIRSRFAALVAHHSGPLAGTDAYRLLWIAVLTAVP